MSDWHVRLIGGFPFFSGTDPGTGCNYFGLDIGTTRASCIGVDAFYRVMSCSDKRVAGTGPGGSPTARLAPRSAEAHFDRDGFGEDGGTFQFVGVKATWQKSFGGSPVYWYVGAGPEYFWTQNYIDDDSGIGAFAETGIAWRFARWGAVRLGLDVHADSTSVTRKSPSNSGKDRLLWTFAPNIGIEFDF